MLLSMPKNPIMPGMDEFFSRHLCSSDDSVHAQAWKVLRMLLRPVSEHK